MNRRRCDLSSSERQSVVDGCRAEIDVRRFDVKLSVFAEQKLSTEQRTPATVFVENFPEK
jgi:hypothetical protein